jgi:hypothetical protein
MLEVTIPQGYETERPAGVRCIGERTRPLGGPERNNHVKSAKFGARETRRGSPFVA